MQEDAAVLYQHNPASATAALERLAGQEIQQGIRYEATGGEEGPDTSRRRLDFNIV
jgi:hypothetical protein